MSEDTESEIISDEAIEDLTDEEFVPGRLVKVGDIRKWRKEYPHSRLIYFEYFDKPYLVRSYTYGDLEKYNALLATLETAYRKKEEDKYKASNPAATEEQILQYMQAIVLPAKNQNIHFLKMVVLFPADVPKRLEEGTIDAGLPNTIIDLAHKGSGFATIDADIISEEI